MENNYIESVRKQFNYYKMLGEQAMNQVPDEALFWQYNENSNSIAILVGHLSGNMLSRFIDFLSADGEKPWRNRDAEFESIFENREELMAQWNKGWNCLLGTIERLTETELDTIVYIRNDGHTVLEAINRQLAHYPYHIGQIVYIAKMIADNHWNSLSIPRNKSNDYNARKFSQDKEKRHFTDDL